MARGTKSTWLIGATGLTLICLCGSDVVLAESECTLRERLLTLLASDTNAQECNSSLRLSSSMNTVYTDTYLDDKMSDRSFREANAISEADRQIMLGSHKNKNRTDAGLVAPNANQAKQPISLPTLDGFFTTHK